MKILIRVGGELVGVLNNPTKEHLKMILEGFKEIWPNERVTTKVIEKEN